MNKITKFLVGAVAAFAIFGFAVSASAAYMHTTTLKAGSRGAQVMELQRALNSNGFVVATMGAGSPGMETMTFGPATTRAVKAFQTANGLTADGVVGPRSGSMIAMLGMNMGTGTGMGTGSTMYPAGCMSTSGFSTTTGMSCSMSMSYPAGCSSTMGYSTTTGMSCAMTTGTTYPAGCMSTSGFSTTTGMSCSGTTGTTTGTTGGTLSGGETSIEDVTLDDADDDTINESTSKAPLASIEFDVEDADAMLTRADIVFQPANGTEEEDPWEVFDKVYLMDGSTVIASMDADDEDMWDDAELVSGSYTLDAYRIRFSNVNRTFKEDASPELWVAADINNNIDGSDSGDADWIVGIEENGLRFVDGAGVDTEEDAGTDTASFSIQESGADSEFSVTEADNSPDAAALEVKSNTSSTQTIAIFNVDTDEDGGDVKINDFPIVLHGSVALSTFIDDVYVVVDGKEYSADGSVGAGTLSGGTYNQTFRFEDIEDDDAVVDAGDDMDITVKVKFKSQGSSSSLNYANGVTVYASTDLQESDVEDADSGSDVGDSSDYPQTAIADTFSLFSDGITVRLTGGETPVITNNDAGQNTRLTYNVKFSVTAFGDDVYLPKVIATTSGTSVGLIYSVENSDGSVSSAFTSGSSAGSLQSSAREQSGMFRVDEGKTETFTATIAVNDAGANGFYHLQLNTVRFSVGTPSTTLSSYTLSPANDFETDDGQITS